MKQFDLDKWLVERYSPLTLERIKKAHFNYDDVIEILNVALRQPPVVGQSEQLVAFLKWVGDGYDFENNAEKIVKEYIDEGN